MTLHSHIEALELLEERALTKTGGNWHITLFSDGSGELYMPDVSMPLTMFNNMQHLRELTKSIVDFADLNDGVVSSTRLVRVIGY